MILDHMKLKIIGMRVFKEREQNRECKFCGNKLTIEQQWENTCRSCIGKPHDDLGIIFEKTVEQKKHENPKWWKKISDTQELEERVEENLDAERKAEGI